MEPRWIEVADRVLVRRHDRLDLSTGLVLGDGHCLVIDTGGGAHWGAQLAHAIRRITRDPWTMVLTHGHFDHCFGTAAFGPTATYAQAGLPHYLAVTADVQRATWGTRYPQARTARLPSPNHLVTKHTQLDIGGRPVSLTHFGPGHTDHDLVVSLPDCGIVFAGDLVEQGAPPSIESGSDLEHWPAALDGVLALRPDIVVPGHGEPVGPSFVLAQRDELADVSAGRT